MNTCQYQTGCPGRPVVGDACTDHVRTARRIDMARRLLVGNGPEAAVRFLTAVSKEN